MTRPRRRLDVDLVERGLVTSRSEAAELIGQGRIRVNGAIAQKPARQVAPGDQIHIVGPPPRYVSRGALKLERALDHFRLDVTNRVVVDAGASTGGFTDVVLQRGARKVYAIDVGHGQLHERLRGDPRVINMERTNVRHLTSASIPDVADLVVGDLSFISLRLVIGPLLTIARPGADLVLLVKPQFEAGRREASRGGGVIRDDAIRDRVRDEVATATEEHGCTIAGWVESPITGADGNAEYLMHAVAPGGSA